MTPYLQQRSLYGPQIHKKPSLNLGIIVVIPAYNEDYLLLSLMSLQKCHLPVCDVEVIVVINNSIKDSAKVKANNFRHYQMAQEWAKDHFNLRRRFYILYHDELPRKHAGVGLARKIGMDEAVYRFERIRNKKGIIACFDADSRCDRNYFQAIEAHFNQFPATQACSIYYEHPLKGHEYPEKVYDAICLYELHLRYYIQAQRWAGFPFAAETIGSSMAVRSDAYQKQGGMNRRKAGEDFYFLHKFTPLGNFSEINTTRVVPSPRVSNRVPFGTGKAVGEILKGKTGFQSYAFNSFSDLKQLFSQVKHFRKVDAKEVVDTLPDSLKEYLKSVSFDEKLKEIQKNTSTPKSFNQRFFRWFDAFQVMKFVHFARDHYYPNVPVTQAANQLWRHQYPAKPAKSYGAKEMLLKLRQWQVKRPILEAL